MNTKRAIEYGRTLTDAQEWALCMAGMLSSEREIFESIEEIWPGNGNAWVSLLAYGFIEPSDDRRVYQLTQRGMDCMRRITARAMDKVARLQAGLQDIADPAELLAVHHAIVEYDKMITCPICSVTGNPELESCDCTEGQ